MSDGAFVYCLHEDGNPNPCKVGVATNLNKRMSSLQGGNWRPLVVAWTLVMPDRYLALQIEAHLLARFRPDIYRPDAKKRLRSEWLEAEPDELLHHARLVRGDA